MPMITSPSGVADTASPNRNQIEKSNKALTRKGDAEQRSVVAARMQAFPIIAASKRWRNRATSVPPRTSLGSTARDGQPTA